MTAVVLDARFANLFAGNRTPEQAVRDLLRRRRFRRPHVVLLCEANNAHDDILVAANREGYRVHFADGKSKGARELAILTRHDVQVDDVSSEQVAEGLRSRIAPDRWRLTVRCRFRGQRFAATVTHWHASLQGKDGGVTTAPGSERRIAQADAQTARILTAADNDRRDGYAPIIAADCNVTKRGNRLPVWSPYQAFPVAGIGVESATVDVIGYDRATWAAGRLHTFNVSGADHRRLRLFGRNRAGLRLILTSKEKS